MTIIKVLVLDENTEFLSSLQQYAQGVSNIDVLDVTTDVINVVDQYEGEDPDVIFYSSGLIKSLDVETFGKVKSRWPEALCYRLTLFDESFYDEYAHDKGFEGSVPRSRIEHHLDRVVAAVKASKR